MLKFLCIIVFSFGLIQNGMSETEGSLGQEALPDTSKIYLFKEIVVTATRTERAVKDLSATISVVTRDAIEASNANSCTDILNTLPGLFVEKTGAFGRADIDIRGIGSRGRQVMVLIDGRPVKMGLFGCTITHSLPLDNVERIEVVRGPLSVLYGSDALGGVINIISRRVKRGFETDLTTSYGNYNTQQYRVRHGGNLDKFNYYLTADKRTSDGHLPNSAYDGKDFTTLMGYKFTSNLEAIFTTKYFDGYKEEPLRATDSDTLISDVWNDYERGALDLTFTHRWEKWNGLAKLYHNFGEHELSDGWHSKDFTNGLILHGSGKLLVNNELTLGVELRQQGGERLSSPAGKWDKIEYAVFLHDEHILSEKSILTVGGRYNYDEIAGSEFCPQIGLVFHPREGTMLRGLVNKGLRSPQLNELYLFPSSNEELKPEVVWNYELGINQRIVEGVNMDLVGYIMKGKNLIQTEENPNPPPMFKFQNTGKFEFKGIEAGLSAQLHKSVSVRIYYTYLNPGEKTKGRPGDKVDLMLRYVQRKLAFSLTSQYVADYFAEDNRENPTPAYFISNTKLSYELIPNLHAFLAIDNILDREYEIYVDLTGGQAGLYSMPKRTFTTGVNFKF